MNLFTNSMKYNKVNGFIYMSMRTIERSEDHVTCEFKIKDNGIGMSEEFIKMNCLLHLYRQIIPHVLIIMGQVWECLL